MHVFNEHLGTMHACIWAMAASDETTARIMHFFAHKRESLIIPVNQSRINYCHHGN